MSRSPEETPPILIAALRGLEDIITPVSLYEEGAEPPSHEGRSKLSVRLEEIPVASLNASSSTKDEANVHSP